MVIQHKGEGQPATCKPMQTVNRNVKEIYWQVLKGIKTNNRTWFANTYDDWDPAPTCTATFDGIGTCQKSLNFTLYSMNAEVFFSLLRFCNRLDILLLTLIL